MPVLGSLETLPGRECVPGFRIWPRSRRAQPHSSTPKTLFPAPAGMNRRDDAHGPLGGHAGGTDSGRGAPAGDRGLHARRPDGPRFLIAPRDLGEVIAVIARAFGWSLAEIKRVPFGGLVEYGGLTASVLVSCILGGGAQ